MSLYYNVPQSQTIEIDEPIVIANFYQILGTVDVDLSVQFYKCNSGDPSDYPEDPCVEALEVTDYELEVWPCDGDPEKAFMATSNKESLFQLGARFLDAIEAEVSGLVDHEQFKTEAN